MACANVSLRSNGHIFNLNNRDEFHYIDGIRNHFITNSFDSGLNVNVKKQKSQTQRLIINKTIIIHNY